MRPLLTFATALALAAGGYAAASSWARPPTAPPAVTVQVVARDFSFSLSRRTVPVGRVRFTVVNRGKTGHDFVIGARRTAILRPGGRAMLDVTFAKAGSIAYRCSVPGHAALGMKGVLSVGRPAATTPTTTAIPATTTSASAHAKLTKIGDFERPVYVTAPLGDSRHLFVVEQAGTIEDVVAGEPTRVFLDLRDQVQEVSERGLLSMAFAPDYARSGRFYVYYTDRVGNGNVNVVEYHRSATDPGVADPNSARTILTIQKPYENHNAGMLQFGPDGYLYIGVGDGDSGVLHDPGQFAQTLGDLLGNILRIDPLHPADGQPYAIPESNPFVDQAGARGEVWDYGLRNPWRFWIDSVTGDMIIGDPGLGGPEEIDYVQGNGGGINFGWPCFQGSVPFDGSRQCDGAVGPIFEYDHGDNRCAVIGGMVVRDPRLPSLFGRYLFGDYCNGKIRSTAIVDGAATDVRDLGLLLGALGSFGVDGRGRIYAASTDGGVYRLDPD